MRNVFLKCVVFCSLCVPFMVFCKSPLLLQNEAMVQLCSQADSRPYQPTVDAGGKIQPQEPFKSIEQGKGYKKIKGLIQHANPDAPGPIGMTPLVYAAFMGNWPAARALLDAGANVNLYVKDIDMTPLSAAAWGGRFDIACKLIQYGARLPSEKKDQDDLFKNVANPLYQGHFEDTAIFAEYLISKGFDVDAPNNGNWTPLMGAASQGNKPLVLVLLKHGAKLDVKNKLYGRTALEEAQIKGHMEIVEILKKAGATQAPVLKKAA